MDDREYACYEVKLNRFLNVQSKQSLSWLAVLLVFFVLYTIFSFVNNTFDVKGLIIFCCVDAAIVIVNLLSNPKCLDVTPDTIKFQYHGALLRLLAGGRIWGGAEGESKYGKTYTVYNIKSIEYLQSFFEKRLSCGHIRICGDVNTGGTGREQRTFTIYGITDFENTSVWMKEFIRLSNDASDASDTSDT